MYFLLQMETNLSVSTESNCESDGVPQASAAMGSLSGNVCLFMHYLLMILAGIPGNEFNVSDDYVPLEFDFKKGFAVHGTMLFLHPPGYSLLCSW